MADLMPSFPRRRESRVLNGIARFARDLKNYLWVADPRQVPFLCSCKEKGPKESTPRSARNPLPFLAPPGARKLAGRIQRASGSISARLETPGGAAVLGARYGSFKNNSKQSYIGICVRALLVVVCAAFMWCPEISLAEIRFVDPDPSESNSARALGYVEISGPIRRGELVSLRSAIDTARKKPHATTHGDDPITFVFLNSRGGDITAAMEMGRFLRAVAAYTLVDNRSECSSACVFLLASGATRLVERTAKIGLHRPFFDSEYFAGLSAKEAQTRYNSMKDGVRKFLLDMGMADQLFLDMMRVPSQSVRYVDSKYAESVGLHGKDAGIEEWDRAKALQRLGKERVKALDRYVECRNSGGSDTGCMKHLSDKRDWIQTRPTNDDAD